MRLALWLAGQQTLAVAGKKIITYPRAEVRYLPQSRVPDVPKIVSGRQSFNAIPVPDPPVIRKGASGSFYDKGLEGASHHAVIPNVNTINKLRQNLYLFGVVFDALIETAPIAAEVFHDPDHTR